MSGANIKIDALMWNGGGFPLAVQRYKPYLYRVSDTDVWLVVPKRNVVTRPPSGSYAEDAEWSGVGSFRLETIDGVQYLTEPTNETLPFVVKRVLPVIEAPEGHPLDAPIFMGQLVLTEYALYLVTETVLSGKVWGPRLKNPGSKFAVLGLVQGTTVDRTVLPIVNPT